MEIFPVPAVGDRVQRSGDGSRRITEGDADPAGSQIKAEDADHRRPSATALRASRMTAGRSFMTASSNAGSPPPP